MDNVKVSLTITLPGSVMVSQQVAENKPKEWLSTTSMMVGEKKDLWRIYITTRKSIPAIQHVNLTKEAYDHMTSKKECPSWDTSKSWSSRSIQGRLESHLQRLCESLGGMSYTYELIED